MSDPEGAAPDSGATVEFSAGEVGARLAQLPAEQLRDELPGLEPERQITDWGRSGRVEAVLDRTVYEFLFHYWFRVEVDGLQNVPGQGAGLLLANRAGGLPADAAMIAKALGSGQQARRRVHVVGDRRLRQVPGLGMLATKAGTVTAHPADLQRLLFDERELVLAFPEGGRGPQKPLRDRYRLRRFDQHLLEIARRAQAPIVPVAVLGAEESLPVLGRIRLPRRLPALPITPPLPLPAKFRIRFLERVNPDELGRAGVAEELRALIQENLLEMVAERRNVWLG